MDTPSRATYRPKDEATIGFPVERTALLVIDPVNDFLSEGGAGWPMTKTVVETNRVVAHLKRAIAAARAAGIPVLYGPMAYTAEDYEEAELQRRSGINRLMFERRMFLAGTWGAQIHPDLLPQEDDIVLAPHKSLDVFETDLGEHLDRLGTTHLVIAGMTANLCCESTGRSAMEAGYDVTYLSDAIGAASPDFYDAAVKVNYPLIANAVMETREFERALDRPAAAGPDLHRGDRVLGSDRREIGTVERVLREGEFPHLVVRGRGSRAAPAYVPLDAVAKRSRDEIFLHVPSPLVQAMGWDAPPSHEGQRAKLGEGAGPPGP